MKWLFLVLGLAIGTLSGAVGSLYFMEREIALATKYFVDKEDYVVASGTLIDRSVGVANNSYTIACYKERKGCWIASLRQTDARSISRIEPPFQLTITQWTSSEITALADGVLGCMKTTMTIERKTKEVLWVDEPVNQSEPKCKTDERARTLHLESSPGWRKLQQAGYGPAGMVR